jgi:dephospho-CoA kinase
VRRPLAVAITGGIAAGKTEALAAFARRGAATVSSDEIVHRLLAEDAEVRDAIRERWGDDAVGNRKRIAEIVFESPSELEWLEQLLHPRTRAVVTAWLETVDDPLAVVEIPLLYETGGEARFDKVVVITAPPEVRHTRRGELDDREARLIPDEEKLRRADYAFVNDGTLADLDVFVGEVVEELSSS